MTSHVSTEELVQIREVLMDSARAVTERLGTGFMGTGSEKVSAQEKVFLARLAAILDA